jgi:hypothetical protein
MADSKGKNTDAKESKLEMRNSKFVEEAVHRSTPLGANHKGVEAGNAKREIRLRAVPGTKVENPWRAT